MVLLRDCVNVLLFLLPTSRFFPLKRSLLRLTGVDVGKEAKINGHTWFYGRGRIRIGDRTWIGPGCQFHSTLGSVINIGSDCDIAPRVLFVTGTHRIGNSARRAGEGYAQNIRVGNGCWLGVRVTVLGGCVVGDSSVIAAGALVNSDLPSNALSAGVPAKVKRIFEV
jgi:maltose O-acetyltransferase